MKIIVKKGLDIPIQGKPEGSPQRLSNVAKQIALNLEPFDDIPFKVLVKVGDSVKIGEPLVESKAVLGQLFVSPAGGVVAEIRRGLKRRLLDIIIDVSDHEAYEEHGSIDLNSISSKELLLFFMRTGLFPHIRLRPFNLVPNPQFIPRAIFVSGVQTLPFNPSFEMQVAGHEKYFQTGLNALAKLNFGSVHLVYHQNCSFDTFTQAANVEKHVVSGPHPAGDASLHIHKIAPIKTPTDHVWSLNAIDVVTIGKMVLEGRYFTDRILAIGGSGVVEGGPSFFAARMGYPVTALIESRVKNQPLRFISGDPLTGVKVGAGDFMGFSHTALSVIPENVHREPFHFFRLGVHKYSATHAYLSGFVKPPKKGYPFTTNQHGEERAFVDGAIYDKVMPMRIPTMQLIKAILAEDFELAQQLGLLEVIPEDFALSTFICPSKIEMIEIVKQGLRHYAKEMGY